MRSDSHPRERRRYAVKSSDDQRAEYARDRDRILYSSAFHRLAGITQVVRAGEADYFHTRQQHTLKVAQVGRRLAEYCRKLDSKRADEWGVEPEVVEAACLGHDLGHPPFGHIGEYTLNELVEGAGELDGFEGNAQSFRIATRIGVRFDETPGLDLTRATLNALLKYPWLRDRSHPSRSKKWSCYEADRPAFDFARAFVRGDDRQCAEAALMDWADDIAYSVHDLEDFQRAGVLPWQLIFGDRGAGKLAAKTVKAWYNKPTNAQEQVEQAVDRLRDYIWAYRAILEEQYDGSREHRVAIRTLTSSLIGRYVRATSLHADQSATSALVRGDEEAVEVLVLKQITRDYVITSPTLLAQQHGQRLIIRGLFEAIYTASIKEGTRPGFLPVRLHYLWDEAKGSIARFTADCIASLTEAQATALYGRLYGTAAGSVLDPIVR